MSACGITHDFNLAEHLLSCGHDADRAVFTYADQSVTYAALGTMTHAMARALLDAGASESDRVLLLMLDTPAFCACFLACMAIGAIPIPLNPKLSAGTLHYIMHDSRARFAVIEADADTHSATLRQSPFIEHHGLFVQDTYHHGVPLERATLIERGLTWVALTSEVSGEFSTLCCPKKPVSTAFWQYSSGTTGRPKAIKHTQIGMLENTELFARRTLGIRPQDRIYSIPKMFFGYGLGNSFFFPLQLGAQALIDSAWPNPARVLENIRRYRPSVFFGVPAMYNALLDRDLGVTREALASVRIWFSAGSPLPEQIYQRWLERFGQPILDGIGATEVGHVFLTNRPDNSRAGSTGAPVESYQVRLINDAGKESAPGEQGVLMVQGPSLSSGYWENPDLNQQKFQDGWYRTGDVFVRDEAGYYSCKGREDDLFKVNGRWVVPVEIENEVHRHFPSVKEAVVVGRESCDGLTETILFVCAEVAAETRQTLKESILAHLAQSLEKHKRPCDCIVLNELPRNDNGKLLRAQLVTPA